jgi:hypothetical protein
MGFLVPATLFAALLSATVQKPPIQFSNPPPSEWVHIDGSKNPELIPEWSVWRSALRTIHIVGQLPTVVATQVSKEEEAIVLTAARENARNITACEERGLKLKPLLETETAAVINRKTQELNLECRSETLRLRDRLLESLRPEGQVALRHWVESIKAGIHVSVPKAELEFYLKPK